MGKTERKCNEKGWGDIWVGFREEDYGESLGVFSPGYSGRSIQWFLGFLFC